MNKNIFKILTVATLVFSLIGCSKWTEPKTNEVVHNGGFATMNNAESEAYYSALRDYKKTAEKYGRPVAFGWFSNWSPTGIIRKGYLSAVPDSMDIISMWSGAPAKADLTEDQAKDKEFVQKVKGIKLLEVSLLSHLGKGRTPDSVYAGIKEKAHEEGWSDGQLAQALRNARWDYWGFTSHDLNNKEELKAALAKFAKSLCDGLFENEWDGFDIDWEPGAGFNDMDGTITNSTIGYLVSEMGKYIGPASDPEGKGHKLLCIDGQISSFSADMEQYVDYWIKQLYGWGSTDFQTPGNHPEKLIITENFEAYSKSGGKLLKQAALMPQTGYKGGVGAYRFDNDYNNYPDYKWMREAIRINQKVFNEWKSKNK